MIDYKILNDSIIHYQKFGFDRIESPWLVTKATSNITKPSNGSDFTIIEKDKVLVASGEQSFLYLYLKGFLPKGRFQTITPCFRNESFDSLHTKYFIKNELIDTLNVNDTSLFNMIHSAKSFFISILENTNKIQCIQTGDMSYDLCYDGIELGSYGIRNCSFLTWIYGTGCAEPRTSYILNSNKNKTR